MGAVADDDLLALLAGYAPFDSLTPGELASVAAGATINRFAPGELILDAFADSNPDVFLVIAGHVGMWHNGDLLSEPADERLGPGGVFGYSAMLTDRSVGPRVVAVDEVTVARIAGAVAARAFTTRAGAQFLVETAGSANQRRAGHPAYSLVDELIVRRPLIVRPATTAAETARQMTEHDYPYAVVRQGDGTFSLLTDSLLRRKILAEGLAGDTPVDQLVQGSAPTVVTGDSAAEALILMLDADAEFLLVADRVGDLKGVISPRDFAVSPTTAGVALHEQLRRASTLEELDRLARRVPSVLGELLGRGLASGKVIAVYSAFLDTIVRRAVGLVLEHHPGLSVDAFTWLALGSNGRREAVLSSDIDSAVAFGNHVPAADIDRYRVAFAEVGRVLSRAGLSSDEHGANAERTLFARTNDEWRNAAREWLAAPADNHGAIMTSLLVDGRPIQGDPGLPAVAQVFGDLRRHPGTMRLLLQESLSRRARMPSFRVPLTRRSGTFDVKSFAILPIVNLGRWAALSVGSAELSTTARLRAAAGSAMLPQDQATTLVEVFDVLQRLRLRYQIRQHESGEVPSDLVEMDQISPLDRSVIAQAVREVASVQRRMDNISHYVPVESWAAPDPT